MSSAKAEPEKHWMPYRGLPGVNHLAYEVDEAMMVTRRVENKIVKKRTK